MAVSLNAGLFSSYQNAQVENNLGFAVSVFVNGGIDQYLVNIKIGDDD